MTISFELKNEPKESLFDIFALLVLPYCSKVVEKKNDNFLDFSILNTVP